MTAFDPTPEWKRVFRPGGKEKKGGPEGSS